MRAWFEKARLWFRTASPTRAETESDVGISSSAQSGSVQGRLKGDSAIRSPEQDAFGIDPFARAIAASIATADASDGLVYAINGRWGSGKSSAINLVLYHLSEQIEKGSLVPTVFNPWWFNGAEALTISFFQEMRATVGKSLDDKAREVMASLGGRLSSAGPLLGGIAAILATPAAGVAAAGTATLIEKLTKLDSTVEKEHAKLATALGAQGKKFLIILDDIDRLNTDDALQIFKLIKSVGRLPNVIYLMAYDRQLAEKMVAERFPAEGASYLEKVVQGAFDLPNPDSDDLRNQLFATVDEVMGAPQEDKIQRFGNVFFDAVAPFLTTPRDVLRLSNAIRVSWPAVRDEVDRADCLAIETMRLFLPCMHQAVRMHPNLLVGAQSERGPGRENLEQEYNGIFLECLPPQIRERAKRALRRLFPRLEAVWNNTHVGSSQQWQRDRLVCSTTHFPTYFAFGVTNDGITSAEINALIANAGVEGATERALLDFLATGRKKGGTRAALALDELNARATDIAESDVGQFTKDIFKVADRLDVEADAPRGFAMFGSNNLRLHWLLKNLLLDRFDIAFRSKVIREATPDASINWLVDVAERCKAARDKRGTKNDDGRENLVDDACVEALLSDALARIRADAAGGALVTNPEIDRRLYSWSDLAGPAEVRAWTDAQLQHDPFVVAIAKAVVSVSLSAGLGGFGSLADRVPIRTDFVQIDGLSKLLDLPRFRQRVSQMIDDPLLDPADAASLRRFAGAGERKLGE